MLDSRLTNQPKPGSPTDVDWEFYGRLGCSKFNIATDISMHSLPYWQLTHSLR